MILDGKSVSQVLEDYGLNYSFLDNDQKELLEKYVGSKTVTTALDFLINVLGVSPKRIEKCPSVLYLNPTELKNNYEELINRGINKEKIIGCLHILSSERGVIAETYDYILDNYGVETFNKNVSILGIHVKRIKELEKAFGTRMSKQALLSAAITTLRIPEINSILNICETRGISVSGGFFQKGVGEINEIINICTDNNVEITGSVFRKSSDELRKIIEVCKEKNVEITGSVFLKDAVEVGNIIDTCRKHNIPISGSCFRRDADEIDDIVDVCNELGISISGTVFLRNADEIRKIYNICTKYGIAISANTFKKSADEICDIVNVCRKHNVDVTATMFKKSASSLDKSLTYVSESFGRSYMIPLIITVEKNHLQKVMPYLASKGTVEALISSPAILGLKFEEILEREKMVQAVGESDVVNGRFNSIYGLSRKHYEAKKKVVQAKGVEIK